MGVHQQRTVGSVFDVLSTIQGSHPEGNRQLHAGQRQATARQLRGDPLTHVSPSAGCRKELEQRFRRFTHSLGISSSH